MVGFVAFLMLLRLHFIRKLIMQVMPKNMTK